MPAGKQDLVDQLEQSDQVLLSTLADVLEGLAAHRPVPDSWSVLECVEHVVVSEDYLFGLATAARAGASTCDEEREKRIQTRGVDRAVKVESPEAARPMGRFRTLAEARTAFRDSRLRTLQFVRDATDDLRGKSAVHPVVGVLNCYELLLMMAVHVRRHALQVEEIKAALRRGLSESG